MPVWLFRQTKCTFPNRKAAYFWWWLQWTEKIKIHHFKSHLSLDTTLKIITETSFFWIEYVKFLIVLLNTKFDRIIPKTELTSWNKCSNLCEKSPKCGNFAIISLCVLFFTVYLQWHFFIHKNLSKRESTIHSTAQLNNQPAFCLYNWKVNCDNSMEVIWLCQLIKCKQSFHSLLCVAQSNWI